MTEQWKSHWLFSKDIGQYLALVLVCGSFLFLIPEQKAGMFMLDVGVFEASFSEVGLSVGSSV